MPNTDETAKYWQETMAARTGRAVRRAREAAGLTALQLSDRTRDIGYPVHRTAIAKIENGLRAGKLDVAELIALALALGVPPIELIYPDLPDGPVEVWPGQQATSFQAAQWFSGERTANDIVPDIVPPDSNERLRLSRERERVRELVSGMGDAWFSESVRSDAERELRHSVIESIERVSRGMAELRSLMSRGGWQWGAGAGDVAQLEERMRRAGMVVDDGDEGTR